MARRKAPKCGEAEKDHRWTESAAQGPGETDAFCESADWQQAEGDRNSSPSRIARRTRRSDSRTRTKTTAQFAETWPDLAEGHCSSGYFAHSTGSRKEARPTKPARSETYRLASGTNRPTDAHELAWTEAITKRKCSGWIGQSAERDSAESQRSEVSDSGPTGITGEPAHSKTNAQATK
jgi:hypothetical protein